MKNKLWLVSIGIIINKHVTGACETAPCLAVSYGGLVLLDCIVGAFLDMCVDSSTILSKKFADISLKLARLCRLKVRCLPLSDVRAFDIPVRACNVAGGLVRLSDRLLPSAGFLLCVTVKLGSEFKAFGRRSREGTEKLCRLRFTLTEISLMHPKLDRRLCPNSLELSECRLNVCLLTLCVRGVHGDVFDELLRHDSLPLDEDVHVCDGEIDWRDRFVGRRVSADLGAHGIRRRRMDFGIRTTNIPTRFPTDVMIGGLLTEQGSR